MNNLITKASYILTFLFQVVYISAQSPDIQKLISEKDQCSDFSIEINELQYNINATSFEIRKQYGAFDGTKQYVELQVAEIKRSEILHDVESTEKYREDEKSIVYLSGNLKVEYLHEKNGVRQNFYIKQKPPGDGPLKIALDIMTNLTALQIHSDEILFCEINQKGTFSHITYSGLKCWDNNLQPLFAELKLKENKVIEIIIDDENATYPITIDPISSTPVFTLLDEQSNSVFGAEAQIAGDINNDGFEDLIVGAPDYDATYSSQGKVYLYLGSSTGFSLTPIWTILGTSPYSDFGTKIERVGDINGDTYDDLFIGNSNTRLYLGSSTGIMTSSSSYSGIPSAIGDINDDDFDDFIITYPYYDGPEINEGKSTLYLGASFGSFTSAWSFEPNQSSAYLSNCINAGDVNGDGYTDIAAGIPDYDAGQTDEGKAYLFYGSALGFSSSPDWVYESNITSYKLGKLKGKSDIDQDGYFDLIIGAKGPDSLDDGALLVFYGSSLGLSSIPDWKYILSGELFSVGADINNDTYEDILILDGYNTNYIHGSITCLLGTNAGFIDEQQFRFYDSENSIYQIKDTKIDFSLDGYNEFLVGVDDYSGAHSAVIMISGGEETTGNHLDQKFDGTQNLGTTGMYVSSVGDINNDGYDDALIASPFYDNTFINAGKVELFLGSASGITSIPAWAYEGDKTDMLVGLSLSSAGDFNSDGFTDIIVGIPKFDDSAYVDQGMVKVFFGGTLGINTLISPWTKKGFQSNCQFGFSISSAGDFNVDGVDDIIVGSPYYDSGTTDEGKVFVFYGSSGVPSLTAGWTAEANVTSANFGYAVSGGGDVNGDGKSDILVGAPNYAKSTTKIGQIYLYFGSSGYISPLAKWQAIGTYGTDTKLMGSSVDITGDYNNDGFNDILTATEKSLVIYNGKTSKPLSTFSSIHKYDETTTYKRNVANGGDINNDGFDDIISGSPNVSNGSYHEGIFYIHYGSYFGLTPDYRYYESDKAQSKLGTSISGNSDLNNDGYSDILIGAPYYRKGEDYTGSYYLLKGFPSSCSDIVSATHTETATSSSFTCSGAAIRYDIRYKISSSAVWSYDSSYASSFTISGLDSCTEYHYQIRTICESGTGPWTVLATLETNCGLPECSLPPEDLSTINLSPTSTKIMWDASDGAIKYTLRYRPLGSATWTSVVVFAIYKDLTGLSPSTTYEYRVRSICPSSTSPYSDIYTFITDPLKMNSLESDNNVSVFPNPGDGNFNIIMNDDEYELMIYDLHGTCMYQDHFIAAHYTFDVSHLSNGIYLIYIRSSTLNSIQKITINK
ncbi:MAG: FG-GAP repeat protein [Fimbriimonadaceae bacterium]|nr:FG-GAP repeat protein [Chitinophagales bacterium]